MSDCLGNLSTFGNIRTKSESSWLACDQHSQATSNMYAFRLGTESWLSPVVSYVQPNHAAAACFPRMYVRWRRTRKKDGEVH